MPKKTPPSEGALIGRRLKKFRGKMGLRRLSELSGVGQEQIWLIQQGLVARVSADVVIRLAGALRREPAELLGTCRPAQPSPPKSTHSASSGGPSSSS